VAYRGNGSCVNASNGTHVNVQTLEQTAQARNSCFKSDSSPIGVGRLISTRRPPPRRRAQTSLPVRRSTPAIAPHGGVWHGTPKGDRNGPIWTSLLLARAASTKTFLACVRQPSCGCRELKPRILKFIICLPGPRLRYRVAPEDGVLLSPTLASRRGRSPRYLIRSCPSACSAPGLALIGAAVKRQNVGAMTLRVLESPKNRKTSIAGVRHS
jgi:hypothetical protein